MSILPPVRFQGTFSNVPVTRNDKLTNQTAVWEQGTVYRLKQIAADTNTCIQIAYPAIKHNLILPSAIGGTTLSHSRSPEMNDSIPVKIQVKDHYPNTQTPYPNADVSRADSLVKQYLSEQLNKDAYKGVNYKA
jgi:hypothetical protein